VCESYSRLSPKPPLDQEYTASAIEHCESLFAYYPDSEFVERGRTIVAGLREKLATKSFLQGEYYFKRKAFDSAILAFNNVLNSFPQSETAPRALLKLLHTYEELGYADEAKEARERLLRDYPESAEAREIRDVEDSNHP
jgi:outer membrane protein assembly factor BamD